MNGTDAVTCHATVSGTNTVSSLLESLVGRMLFIEQDTWRLHETPPGISSMTYRRIDSRMLQEAGRGVSSKTSELDWVPLVLADRSSEVRWSWLAPDPAGMSSTDLYEHVQQRRMSPLTVRTLTQLDSITEWRIRIVPEQVLLRPTSSALWACFGEPWCHHCNKTFFWDPDVEEVPSWPGGYCAVVCSGCGRHLPV